MVEASSCKWCLSFLLAWFFVCLCFLFIFSSMKVVFIFKKLQKNFEKAPSWGSKPYITAQISYQNPFSFPSLWNLSYLTVLRNFSVAFKPPPFPDFQKLMELNLDYYWSTQWWALFCFSKNHTKFEFLLVICYRIFNLLHKTTRNLFIGCYKPAQLELSSEISSEIFQ